MTIEGVGYIITNAVKIIMKSVIRDKLKPLSREPTVWCKVSTVLQRAPLSGVHFRTLRRSDELRVCSALRNVKEAMLTAALCGTGSQFGWYRGSSVPYQGIEEPLFLSNAC